MSVQYEQEQLIYPYRFPHQYLVRVYCSRMGEILQTPDAQMVVGVSQPSSLLAVAIVLDWRCFSSASSAVTHYGADHRHVPQVYMDCRFEDGLLFATPVL